MPVAPDPIYNSSGALMLPWSVTLRYDDTRDCLVVVRHRGAGISRAPRISVDDFSVDDLEDALSAVHVASRTYHARRLF
jgi:hypothetical protein